MERETRTVRPSWRTTAILSCIMVLTIVGIMAAVAIGSPSADAGDGGKGRTTTRNIMPTIPLPKVEPVTYRNIAPLDARALNATIPFSTDPNPAARPFRAPAKGDDRVRALDCLAAVVLYEAGNDPVGQRAVAQVVLNRVRHPAFPKTVCGVVFQGSDRQTGCQFTFACNGALMRSYPETLWRDARRIADAALSGGVYKPVGHATHYHTDWVVPYWSSSLDKVAAVHTHLFFRWTGWWGTPTAFRYRYEGKEPYVEKLAVRFPEHLAPGAVVDPAVAGAAPAEDAATTPEAVAAEKVDAGVVHQPMADDPDVFLVVLKAKDQASFEDQAQRTCGKRTSCKFVVWTDPKSVPHDASTQPTPAQFDTMAFSYLRDRTHDFERFRWNCKVFDRPKTQCL